MEIPFLFSVTAVVVKASCKQPFLEIKNGIALFIFVEQCQDVGQSIDSKPFAQESTRGFGMLFKLSLSKPKKFLSILQIILQIF